MSKGRLSIKPIRIRNCDDDREWGELARKTISLSLSRPGIQFKLCVCLLYFVPPIRGQFTQQSAVNRRRANETKEWLNIVNQRSKAGLFC